jgi:fructose transport system substrate-binding protein
MTFYSRALASIVSALLIGSTAPALAAGSKQLTFAFIIKTNKVPVFVLDRQEALTKAKAMGIKLLTFAGSYNGDNAGQVMDIEKSIAAGVNAIIIVPNDGKAIIPAIQKAEKAGVKVIVFDTPLEEAGIADGTFAYSNYAAGKLIGEWARKALGKKASKARIAMLVSEQTRAARGVNARKVGIFMLAAAHLKVADDITRDTGFLNGFGVAMPDPDADAKEANLTAPQASASVASLSQSAMAELLRHNQSISVVYSMNEQAAAGAAEALKKVGLTRKVLSASIDGTCPGLQMIQQGTLGATVMQHPLQMVDMSLDAAYKLVTTGEKPPASPGLGFYDTGGTLVTDHPASGVQSVTATEALKLRGPLCAAN